MSKVTEVRNAEFTTVVDIKCNRCGKSCRSGGNIEALHIEETWGYNSPWDCENWQADLCIECSKDFELWLKEAGGKLDKSETLLTGEILGEKEEN